jgi:hypothetical protein
LDISDFTTTRLLFRGLNRDGKPQKSKHLTAENAEFGREEIVASKDSQDGSVIDL